MNMITPALGLSNVQLTSCRRLLKTFALCFFLSLSIHVLAGNDGRGNEPVKTTNFLGNTSVSTYKLAGGYFAADTTIRGRILDSAGAPLAGVSVMISGTNRGTTTNSSGNFVLPAVPPGATLVIKAA